MTKISNDEEKEVSRAEALRVLHQRILNCRLCEEHGYIPVARPLVHGHASDRVMVIQVAVSCRNGLSKQDSHADIFTNIPTSVHSRAATLGAIQEVTGTGVHLHKK